MNSLLKKFTLAIKKYSMLENGDSVGVFLSGGKDSLTLLHLLSKVKIYCHIRFSIRAILLDTLINNVSIDYTEIGSFCKNLDVPLHVVTSPLWEIVFVRRKEKNPCSLCSKMRKGILNTAAVNLGCNKVALGHNFDDAIETLLMNTLYNCHLHCFSPVTYLSNKNITMIRPLVFCTENHIKSYAKAHNFPVILNNCPANKHTNRQKMKDQLNLLEKNFNIHLKQNIFKAFLKLRLNGW